MAFYNGIHSLSNFPPMVNMKAITQNSLVKNLPFSFSYGYTVFHWWLTIYFPYDKFQEQRVVMKYVFKIMSDLNIFSEIYKKSI